MSHFLFRSLKRHARFYSTKTLVQLENAQVHRFGTKEPAFKNLSLTLKEDQRLVIVGPVSAGKTTLAEVDMLADGTLETRNADADIDDCGQTFYSTSQCWKMAHYRCLCIAVCIRSCPFGVLQGKFWCIFVQQALLPRAFQF